MQMDRQFVQGTPQPTMMGVSSTPQPSPAVEDVKAMGVSSTPQPSPAVNNDVKAIDALHLYKNRLQSFAQKKNLKIPEYSCQREGPFHASRFRCNVTVDGKTYEWSELYNTVKEAEYAAAKLAWDSLAANETQQDDCGLYKNLLQELAQKRGLCIPEYEAIVSGPPYMPTFLSIVKVGGHSFQGEVAKSKKQAEMTAAKVAYYGLINGVENSDGEKTASNEPRVTGQPGVGNKDGEKTVSNEPCVTRQPDARHLYKNRLQSFAQKKNLKMPEYSCQHEGSTHPMRFRCNVTVDGKTYGGSEFYYTVKEAEHAAAKLAWDSLAANETQQEDCGLYKNLLQELAQKRGLHVPEYEAIISGPPHMPTFLSIVKVGGQSFQGEAAKSKKQAEMIAAKVAYYGLISGVENSDGEKTVSNEPRVARQPGSENASLPVFPSGSAIAQALDQSTTVMQFVATTAPNQNGERNTGGNEGKLSSLNNGDVGSIGPSSSSENAKRLRLSPPNEACACVPDVDQGAGGVSNRYFDKIFVVPRVANMEFPEGADFFPFSDDKWVAYKIKQPQS